MYRHDRTRKILQNITPFNLWYYWLYFAIIFFTYIAKLNIKCITFKTQKTMRRRRTLKRLSRRRGGISRRIRKVFSRRGGYRV